VSAVEASDSEHGLSTQRELLAVLGARGRFREEEDTMNRFVRIASIAVFVGLASQGCGQEEDDIETTQSALVGFGAWTNLPNGLTYDAPALANGDGLTAFGLGTDMNIYVTKQTGTYPNEQWTGAWGQLSGGAFATRPSAAAFESTPGSLAQRFAIVAMRDDGMYYLTIRDQTGTINDKEWTAVPNGWFIGAPSLIYIPPDPDNVPSHTLVLAGLGTDHVVYYAKNTLTKTASTYSYNHANWTGWQPIQNRQFTGAPAMTFACPANTLQPTMMIAARDSTGYFWSSKWNGSSWSDWTFVQQGQFFDGPAMATGCSDSFRETIIYGKGLDYRIYWSKQLSSGPNGFTAIGSDTFIGSPQAVGQKLLTNQGRVHVAGTKSGGATYSNKSLSP
jgi:hypothetical protein